MGLIEIASKIYAKTKGGKNMIEAIKKVLGKIEGVKTYVMLAGIVLTEASYLAGWVGPESRVELLKAFGIGAAATFSAKINRGIILIKQLIGDKK